MKRRTAEIITLAGLTSFLAMTALAFWPTEGKYPWKLPVAAAGCVLLAVYRRYMNADGDSPYLIAIGFVAVFAAMTLLDVGEGFGIPAPLVILVVVAAAVVPFAAFLVALVASGSADDPYEE